MATVINTFGLNGVHVLADGPIKGFLCGINEVLVSSVRVQLLEQMSGKYSCPKGISE